MGGGRGRGNWKNEEKEIGRKMRNSRRRKRDCA